MIENVSVVINVVDKIVMMDNILIRRTGQVNAVIVFMEGIGIDYIVGRTFEEYAASLFQAVGNVIAKKRIS